MSDTDRHVDDDPTKSTIETEDPVRLRSELDKVRREAAKYRTEARTLREGPNGADFKAKDNEIRELKVRTGLAEGMLKHGVAKPTLLRAYLSETGAMKRLSEALGADDFDEQIDTEISEALHAEPALKGRSDVPRRSGPDFSTSGVYNDQLTREELASMSGEQIVEARKAGRLRDVLRGGRQ